ncbi:MAG: hypothetical protein H7831_15115, partial [Magnetococcus sp. WYHC-3]
MWISTRLATLGSLAELTPGQSLALWLPLAGALLGLSPPEAGWFLALALVLGGAAGLGQGPRQWGGLLWRLRWFVVTLLVLHGVLTPAPSMAPLGISLPGLATGLTQVARLLLLFILVRALFARHTPDLLLSWWSRRVGSLPVWLCRPLQAGALHALAALQTLPWTRQAAATVYQSQRAAGVPRGVGGFALAAQGLLLAMIRRIDRQ